MSYKEFRGFGPPGTGKTQWLARQIRRAHSHYGSVDKLMVASFTKTAANEISTRAELKQGSMMGTLHSICYNLLGRPEIAETKAAKWNEYIEERGIADFKLNVNTSAEDADEPGWAGTGGTGGSGDSILQAIGSLRARKVPVEMWRAEAQSFWKHWSEFKSLTEMVDFGDLIELPLRDRIGPPSGAECGFFDEVQDFTRMELDLVRMWATRMDYIILVGDDDQCLFDFKGSTPDAFLNPPIDDEHKTVLTKSHRVPRAVHALADEWIRNVRQREKKIYEPRDEEGSVEEVNDANWRHPNPIIDDIENEIDSGKSVMLIATCGYLLYPAIQELRKRGIPFHNPYRRKRGDWNPLKIGGDKKSATDRLLAWMRARTESCWTNADVKLWTEHAQAKGLLKRGAKQIIDRLADGFPMNDFFMESDSENVFEQGMDNEAFSSALNLDFDWLDSRLLGSRAAAWQFPISIAKNRGLEALKKKPSVVVGTIHSVKGGEADTTYVFPDLSPGGAREWISVDRRDPIIRTFYVAFTRARTRLVLAGRAQRAAVSWRI